MIKRKQPSNPPLKRNDMKQKLQEFEVTVVGFRNLIVKAKNQEDAHKRICDHNPHMGWDWEVDEFRVKPEPLSPHDVERHIAHGAVRMEDL